MPGGVSSSLASCNWTVERRAWEWNGRPENLVSISTT